LHPACTFPIQDANLTKVNAAWEHLSEHIRAAILALVAAGTPLKEDDCPG
jgi:hypothetical protein